MPKKVKLVNHLSSQQLKSKYRASSDPIEGRRWHLLWKISLGWNLKNSALAVGINYYYASKIVKKYNEGGEEGIINKHKTKGEHQRGKKPLLSDSQLKKLAEALEKEPEDKGVWSGPKVARWIEKETGVEKVWNQRGWDYLKKSNYSWQIPRPKHRKGDKEQQEQFKKDLPQKVEQLKERFPNAEVEVWFFDEHRVGLKPILRKIWSPRGERPEAIVHHRYEWLYVYGFVNPKTGETCWYLIPRVNTQWLSLVYKEFSKQVGASPQKKILLVEDRAGWHRSPKAEVPEDIVVELLPPYSPELQPAERLWCLVDEPLANKYFETLDELEEVLAQRCCILEEMKDEIKNLTNYHWLTYP